jgi:branched-chain amino acid transport system ATP-binding protein
MLLKVKDLVAAYGSFQALRRLGLEASEGEIVTLLGANGAGKTTLVKAIAGLLRPKSGSIAFDGERIDLLPSYEIFKKGIAVCPEGGSCFPKMSVYKNLMMGALLVKDRLVREEVYERVVDLFPVLKSRKMQKAGLLSGGERQMLAIGRGLMGKPRMFLLDEPSLGLAPLVVHGIFEAVGKLRDQGLTILLVEQNASKSLKIADRAYVVELGKIIISGNAEELSEDERIKEAYFGL